MTGFVPKAAKLPAGPAWHFIGIQIASASVFAPLPDGVPAETVAGIYRERVAQAPGRIRGWRLNVPFVDVGTPRDYLDAALALAGRGGGESVVEAGAAVDDAARLDRSVVWAGARIGARRRSSSDCVVAGDVAVPCRLSGAERHRRAGAGGAAGRRRACVDGMRCRASFEMIGVRAGSSLLALCLLPSACLSS